jgi:hypothetical protein
VGGAEGGDLRASDREREQAVAKLRDAVVDGRLTLEEFTERVGLAHQTPQRRELERLVADLPAAQAPPEAPVETAHRAIFSELTRRGRWRVPPRSAYRSIFGTIELDLRDATLSGELTELDVYNFFGTVTVIVPVGAAVEVEGGGVLASQKLQTPAHPVVADAPRLLIRARGAGGTLYVRGSPRPDGVEAVLRRLGLGRNPD